ncbi:hypothetical protein PR048_031359 [Dryococelus australis]|uniref:Uncharacterized protein n=1 Tax=Dryococelus australis TaxID=614101 RepID=A0ABQ9G658_9NEOP|nr:hypothetical protein PR048_031359 [Dryococelus australis]
MGRCRNERAGKREIPEKTHRSVASSITIPICENPGVTHAVNRTRFALVRDD